MSRSKLRIVKNKKDLRTLIDYCKQTKYASFDYETSSTKYINPDDYPLCLGVSYQPGISWCIPLAHKESPFRRRGKWLRYLRIFGREVLSNPEITKVAWNLKFELKWSLRYNIVLRGRLFDGLLAKYCLDEERPHDLKSTVDKFFPEFSGYEHWADGIKWVDKPLDGLMKYCGMDSDLTLRIMTFLEPKLIKHKFYPLFRNLLMPGSKMLAEAEYRGVCVNDKYLERLVARYKTQITESDKNLRATRSLVKFQSRIRKERVKQEVKSIRLEIDKLIEDNAKEILILNREKKIDNIMSGVYTGKLKKTLEPFNLNSPNQIIEFFFTSKHGLRLPIIKFTKDKKTKKPTNRPSTDESVLEDLKKKDKSGFMEKLLAHRTLTKLDGTYISGMLQWLDPWHRVHASFQLHGTVTGRLSCVQPNLQNIPRDTTSSDIKTMFIPPRGYVLLEVDYSQAELRVVAELAQDEVMIDIFKRNFNIHTATAVLIEFGNLDRYDEIKALLKDVNHPDNLKWEKKKKKAKTINFGILYGEGPAKLAEQMETSEKEAAEFIKAWLANYPGVAKWMKAQVRFCRKHEFVYNIFGRKRRLPDINSEYEGFRRKAERDCINAPVQGAASDFTTLSQIVIREAILKGELPIDMYEVYTVHDSIGFYIRPKDIHKVVPKIVEICANPQTLRYFGFKLKHVWMKTSPEVGVNWGSLREYDETVDYRKLLKEESYLSQYNQAA